MLYGTITKWNDERGFGFIKPDNENSEVFVHISAFGKAFRRPVDGDRVCFETVIETGGKLSARNAGVIETCDDIAPDMSCRSAKKQLPRSKYQKVKPGSGLRKKTAIFLIAVIFLYSLINKFSHATAEKTPVQKTTEESVKTTATYQKFSCSGKVYCSEMESYEEALFYIRHCPGTKMDGDGDGCPCENQFKKGW